MAMSFFLSAYLATQIVGLGRKMPSWSKLVCERREFALGMNEARGGGAEEMF